MYPIGGAFTSWTEQFAVSKQAAAQYSLNFKRVRWVKHVFRLRIREPHSSTYLLTHILPLFIPLKSNSPEKIDPNPPLLSQENILRPSHPIHNRKDFPRFHPYHNQAPSNGDCDLAVGAGKVFYSLINWDNRIGDLVHVWVGGHHWYDWCVPQRYWCCYESVPRAYWLNRRENIKLKIWFDRGDCGRSTDVRNCSHWKDGHHCSHSTSGRNYGNSTSGRKRGPLTNGRNCGRSI